MTLAEIKELSGMGFTNDQILVLAGSGAMPGPDQAQGQGQNQEQGQNQAQNQNQAQGQNQGQSQNQEQGQSQNQEQGQNQNQDRGQSQDQGNNTESVNQKIGSLEQKINDFIRTLQQNNLKTAMVNVLPDADLNKKVDAAMSELIRPTMKKEE